MSSELVDYSGLTIAPQVFYAYNAQETEIQHDVAGKTHRFCPKDEDRHGLGPGITPISAIPGRLPEGKTLEARSVVVHLFGEDGRSGPMAKAGVRLLTGDPKKDPHVIKEAEDAANEKRYTDARAKIRWHEKAVLAAKEAKVDPPIPGKDTLEAYKFVREHDGGVVATHPCPVCNHPAYSEGERLGHLQDIHGINAAEETPSEVVIATAKAERLVDSDAVSVQLKALQDQVAALTAKPKRGRPRKVAHAEA
jgi:hypothetical protein